MFKKMTKGTINDNDDDSDEYSLLKSESLAMEEMVGKNKNSFKKTNNGEILEANAQQLEGITRAEKITNIKIAVLQ